jgi:hemerythrin-like metal-binding protein
MGNFKSVNLLVEIQTHFESEEKILEVYAYSDLDIHREIHAQVESSARDLVSRYKDGDITGEEVIIKMLQSCIIEHLITEDIKFFGLVKERSVS